MPAAAAARGVGVGEVAAGDLGQPVEPAPGRGAGVAGDQGCGGVDRGGDQGAGDLVGQPADRHRPVQGRGEGDPGSFVAADRGRVGGVGVQGVTEGAHQVGHRAHVGLGRGGHRLGLDQRDRTGRGVDHRVGDHLGVPAGDRAVGQRRPGVGQHPGAQHPGGPHRPGRLRRGEPGSASAARRPRSARRRGGGCRGRRPPRPPPAGPTPAGPGPGAPRTPGQPSCWWVRSRTAPADTDPTSAPTASSTAAAAATGLTRVECMFERLAPPWTQPRPRKPFVDNRSAVHRPPDVAAAGFPVGNVVAHSCRNVRVTSPPRTSRCVQACTVGDGPGLASASVVHASALGRLPRVRVRDRPVGPGQAPTPRRTLRARCPDRWVVRPLWRRRAQPAGAGEALARVVGPLPVSDLPCAGRGELIAFRAGNQPQAG